MKKYKIFAFLALLIGIAVMGHTGQRLLETKQVYQEGNAVYDNLSYRVKKTAAPRPPQVRSTEPTRASETETYMPDFEIEFETLRTINKDTAAWLYSPNTVIDYPVMKAKDYSYYLNHLSDGTVNANGSLFIDYNNASDFSGQLTVIYGHNMKSGRMFGGLEEYKKQGYYEEHPVMYLYTEDRSYRIDILYGCVIGAGQWRERSFMYEQNAGSLLAYAKSNTTFESGGDYSEGDRVVVLSTCSYEFDDARYIVIGVLRPE